MDSYEGTATLEWWANRSTCLGRFGVRVEVGVTGSGWTCGAALEPSLTGEDRESFDFLMALDPLFTLRFDEETVLHVNVTATEDGGVSLLPPMKQRPRRQQVPGGCRTRDPAAPGAMTSSARTSTGAVG